MKKIYVQPVLDIYHVETTQVVALSQVVGGTAETDENGNIVDAPEFVWDF